jgi:hypothetical protein
VNGGGGTAIIGMNLQFANGQTTGIAAMGDFTIYRPSFSGFSKIDPQFPNSPRSFLWDGNVLSYGNPQTDEHEQYWEVNVDSKYNGAIGILQLLKAKYVQNYGLFPMPYNVLLDTGENDWLDGNAENYEQNPYSATNAWTHKIALTDKPKADLNTVFPYNIHMEGHFTDYLRFQPIGDGSIFVTLGQNDWSMEGLGSLFLGLLTNYTPEPSDLTGSDQFPVWKGQKNE